MMSFKEYTNIYELDSYSSVYKSLHNILNNIFTEYSVNMWFNDLESFDDPDLYIKKHYSYTYIPHLLHILHADNLSSDDKEKLVNNIKHYFNFVTTKAGMLIDMINPKSEHYYKQYSL